MARGLGESFSLARLRAEMLGELVGDTIPRIGIERRRSLRDDVRPQRGVLVIKIEPAGLGSRDGVWKNCFGRALWHANAAVDALVWVNDEHILTEIEAVDGADLDAIHVFAFDAVVGDDMGHHSASRARWHL